VLPDAGLAAGLLITHPGDGRVMFVLPWMNRTLVGTTDTFYDDRPDDAAAEPEDVDYLLTAYNHYLAPARSRGDVLATLAGLRPLLRGKARTPSGASREFGIFRAHSGLWSIAGGKYTTYRLMAQSLVDHIVEDLGGSRRTTPCRTAEHRLIGTPAEDWQVFRQRECEQLPERFRVAPEVAAHLVDRYGRRARVLLEEFGDDPTCHQSIIAGEPDIQAELRHQAAHELAQCPADHYLRRTRLGLFHPELVAAPARLTSGQS
jgi:glycerol-3-phosphate dehydrogenase